MDLIRLVEDKLIEKKNLPDFKAGDTITVNYKIVEGNKERIQSYKGVVIQIKGTGLKKTFTVRKISNGVGVERIFPLYSPFIESIEINKRGKVRKARIFYIRNLKGKKAKIKEKYVSVEESNTSSSE
ncbi:MAG: 50S ribosomal protein L19 [Bacteroidales bacterium]|nr:50S ribosomal protein L19 [Bacteroidales bacterium]